MDAARRHYRQREARRRAEREAERQAWLQRVREVVPRIAAQHPSVQRVVLFGSLVKPTRFRRGSDIDFAVVCDSPEAKSAFWQELERELGRSVDLRPLSGAIAEEGASDSFGAGAVDQSAADGTISEGSAAVGGKRCGLQVEWRHLSGKVSNLQTQRWLLIGPCWMSGGQNA